MGIHGQISRPAAIEAAAFLFLGIEHAVAIAVVAEEQLRRHALDEQQFLQAVERAVFAVIRRRQRLVVVVFRATFARRIVGVEPIENRVGDVFGHIGQRHQEIVPFAARGVDFQERVRINLAGFIGHAEMIRLRIGS